MSWRKIVLVLAIIAIAGGFLWWWQAEGQYKGIEFSSDGPEVLSPEEYVRYYEALKKAYAEDQYGGATPEETLQLFIDALKAEDVDLASKYFVVEEQEEIKKELEVGRQNNNLDFLVGFLESVDHGTEIGTGQFRFTVVEDNTAVMSFDLTLNNETNKWKMSEL